MRNAVRVARIAQLVGAALIVLGVVACATTGIDGSGAVGGLTVGGLLLVVAGRVTEWLTKE